MRRFLDASFVCLVLGAVAPPATGQPPKDTTRGDRMLDSYFRIQTQQIADACLADIKSKADWEKKRPELRRQFLEMMGLWPLPPKTDLKPVVIGRVEGDAFVIEKLHFQSSPGLYVSANLYVPKKAKLPAPAVLYVCGHASTIEGKVSFGHHVNYQHHPAWFAANGYVCLIVDTLQLGEIQGIHHGTHNKGMWWWQTLGYTSAGIECWNAMRALDYLETRREADPKRIGVTGRSGGGATSWWLAAADERPQCIIPVAGIADLWSHVVEGVAPRFKKGVINGHCDCMYMVNTYRWDFALVAALCAPRPLLLGNSDKDDIFPVPGYRSIAEKVRKIYDLYGAGDKFALLETAGPHKDTPELRHGAFRWMNRWLKGDPGPVVDPERPRFTPQQLKVFDRLPDDAINAIVQETFIKPARPELPNVPEVAREWWKNKRQEWIETLKEKVFRGWPKQPLDLKTQLPYDLKFDELRVRAFDFTSERGVDLRLWLVTPEALKKPKVVLLQIVDETEWRKWISAFGPVFRDALQVTHEFSYDVQKFRLLRGTIQTMEGALAIVAPRGIGPTRWSEADTPADNHIRRRFALLGQTLDGQRVWDVRRALAVLRGVPDLKGIPVGLTAHGEMAGIALYASLFEPSVAELQLRNLPASHHHGPIFLNVRRTLDIPQALALAFPRRIELHVAPEAPRQPWDWPIQLQRALGEEYLKIRAASD